MSAPINPESTHRRVLAALATPRTNAEVERLLSERRLPVSRAIARLRQRGLVRVVKRVPRCTYVAVEPTIAVAA